MCLTTNQDKPFIASNDIKCYKELIKYCTKTMYETPFRFSTILFKNGVCIQQCDEFGISYNKYDVNEHYIFEGIHSKNHISYCPPTHCFKIAIIPKGTEFYTGNCNDLVSLKLIIFENKFRYWIYKTFHK